MNHPKGFFIFNMTKVAPPKELVDRLSPEVRYKDVAGIQDEFIANLEKIVSLLKQDKSNFKNIDLSYNQRLLNDKLWVYDFITYPKEYATSDIPKEPVAEKTYRPDVFFLFSFNSLATDDDLREAFSETDKDVKEAGIIQFVENKEQNKVCLWVTLPNKKKFALVSQSNITKLSFDVVRASESALESFSHDEDVYKYFRPLSDHRLNAALEISRELGMGESKPMSDADFNRIFNNG